MIVDANGCITLFAGVDGIPFYTVLVSYLKSARKQGFKFLRYV